MTQLTFSRYSTARSGLKKAALIAASISVLAKPMLSILAIAALRSSPRVRAEGSSNRRFEGGDADCGAGEGVVGTLEMVEVAGAGAAGTAGDCAGAGAGVEGAALLDDATAGAFGCVKVRYRNQM